MNGVMNLNNGTYNFRNGCYFNDIIKIQPENLQENKQIQPENPQENNSTTNINGSGVETKKKLNKFISFKI